MPLPGQVYSRFRWRITFPTASIRSADFRISVTNAPRPVSIGQPENIAGILAVPGGKRTAKQEAELLAHYRGMDAELQQRVAALAIAKQPLPVDPKLVQLRNARTEAQRPLPPDERLESLRRDADLSSRQLGNSRLTFAQDLVWALINSPAFLFNH